MIKQTKVVFIILLLATVFSCSPNPTDLAKRYPKIYNTHNVKEIVSLYTDDAVFKVVGQFSLNGKDQIRNITRYDSVLNIHMSIGIIKTYKDTAFCNLTETNDWLKTAEIGEAYYTVKFVFHNGLIRQLQAEAKPETQQAFNQVLSHLMKWASENKATILTEMMPEGRFIYNAENARKTLALLRAWKESTK
jgi:hypothetical protein